MTHDEIKTLIKLLGKSHDCVMKIGDREELPFFVRLFYRRAARIIKNVEMIICGFVFMLNDQHPLPDDSLIASAHEHIDNPDKFASKIVAMPV